MLLTLKSYLSIGLAIALAFCYWQWDSTSHKLDQERLARENDRKTYQLAQQEAATKSYEEALRKERENAKKAREADQAYASLLSKYNASIVRYKAAQSTASTINLSSSSYSTDGDNERSESTTISITISDAQICADNTARLQAAHEWAKSLNQ